MRTFFFCKYWIASDWQCRSWGTIVLRQRHHKDPLGHAFMGLIVGGLRFLEAQDLFGVRELCHHQTTLQYFPSNMWWGSRFGVSPYVVVIVLVQFSSVAQSCLTLCNPMNHSMPGLPVHHQLLEFTQTHVHWVGDAIQPSHPLSSPSFTAFNLS